MIITKKAMLNVLDVVEEDQIQLRFSFFTKSNNESKNSNNTRSKRYN